MKNKNKRNFWSPENFGFDHSAKLSTGIVHTKGDVNIYSHIRVCEIIPNKNLSKLFQTGD